MNCSELIEFLKEFIIQHGDLPTATSDDGFIWLSHQITKNKTEDGIACCLIR